jgi:hypothetical protein
MSREPSNEDRLKLILRKQCITRLLYYYPLNEGRMISQRHIDSLTFLLPYLTHTLKYIEDSTKLNMPNLAGEKCPICSEEDESKNFIQLDCSHKVCIDCTQKTGHDHWIYCPLCHLVREHVSDTQLRRKTIGTLMNQIEHDIQVAQDNLSSSSSDKEEDDKEEDDDKEGYDEYVKKREMMKKKMKEMNKKEMMKT